MAATMAGKSVGKTAYLMVGMSVVWKNFGVVVEKAVCSVVCWDNLMVDLMAEMRSWLVSSVGAWLH